MGDASILIIGASPDQEARVRAEIATHLSQHQLPPPLLRFVSQEDAEQRRYLDASDILTDLSGLSATGRELVIKTEAEYTDLLASVPRPAPPKADLIRDQTNRDEQRRIRLERKALNWAKRQPKK